MDSIDTPTIEPRDPDEIPPYLIDAQPPRSGQFALRSLFWVTTLCGCYVGLERACGGNAGLVLVGMGWPLALAVLWGAWLVIAIADRLLNAWGLVAFGLAVFGLVLFGAIYTYRI